MMQIGSRQCAGILATTYAILAYLVNKNVPEPYMDEIFHIPQTQKYCNGEWTSWDSKITTFPGLYFLGYLVAHLISPFSSPDTDQCSTAALRATNVIFAIGCLPIFYYLAAALDPKRSHSQLVLLTMVAAFYPLHFFYSFLYYTDVPSLFFTLSTWLAASHNKFILAGLLGAYAVLMRQTNAVWVAFIAARSLLDMCLYPSIGIHSKKERKNNHESDTSLLTMTGLQSLNDDISYMIKRIWVLRWYLVQKIWPLAFVVLSFAVFVILNGGIVVGDKANHTPVQHFMQPLYYALYYTTFLAPLFWNPSTMKQYISYYVPYRRKYTAIATSIIVTTLASFFIAYIVKNGTFVHPFLIADNRHYTFYIWRRIVNSHPLARYVLIPFYIYSMLALNCVLAKAHRHLIDRLLLAGTVCIVLVPAHLIEFRYFTMPFYATLLMMDSSSHQNHHHHRQRLRMVMTLVAFVGLNVLTMYMFLYRPFQWPDGSIARFLW